MKIADADILIIPGYKNSGSGHWQTRWEAKMKNARRVQQAEWSKPVREDWVKEIQNAITSTTKPVVLVAHSLGVAAAVHATVDTSFEDRHRVAGAFFVAPPDVANPKIRPKHLMTFGPYPTEPLPYPSFVVASRDDPFGSYESAVTAASAWGSFMVDAGERGHINEETGHGPWPEGMMSFAKLMHRLG